MPVLPLPILSGLPTALPSVRADGGLLRGRWIGAASVVGSGHRAAGTTAQDAYCFAPSWDGSALVLAVCDGLGSHPVTSQIGAELLARLCCHHAAAITGADALEHGTDVLVDAIDAANRDLIGIQQTYFRALRPEDLHSTLLLCRLPSASHGGPALFARAGDTEAFLLRDSHYDTVFPARREGGPTNYVSGPLPHPDPHAVLEVMSADLVADALILATDGLAHDLFESPGSREWLARRWSVPCGPHRMLDSLRYRRESSHDDRTALIAWLRPGQEGVVDAGNDR